MDSHTHTLVADVVALAEVVCAARAGEGYRPKDRRDPDLVYVLWKVGDALGGLGDVMMTTSTISTLSIVL
jgi:hypothetical protein